MTPEIVLAHDRVTLFHGDAENAGEVIAENSVDAIVSDPPSAIGFMGTEWDDDRGGYDGWIAWLAKQLAPAYRALKPGGHGLFWALPRTSHWTARGIELAGFEIRDMHHDILSLDDVARGFVASLDDAQRQAFARLFEGASAAIYYQIFGQGFPKSLTSKSVDIPEWAGTALKPAVEHWILVRKPLDGTVAATHAKWGTGVLNIDACRIGGPPRSTGMRSSGVEQSGTGSTRTGSSRDRQREYDQNPPTGRWPAHLSLDEFAADMLDEQTGELRSGEFPAKRAGIGYKDGAGGNTDTVGERRVMNTGGASRFFYVAKPARSEKECGLDHLTPSTAGEATGGREEGSAGLNSPRAGAGRTSGALNSHPTVKSVALMRWLIRLITPTGGVVLDPFAGSGTTGVAALEESMRFVGVEQGGPRGKYIPILVGRIRHALEASQRVTVDPQLELFDAIGGAA